MMNVDEAKSYATEANLMKVLEKHGLDKARPVIVCTRTGRFTAIFGYRNAVNFGACADGDPMFAARLGFITIA